jgi:hypothetical protein
MPNRAALLKAAAAGAAASRSDLLAAAAKNRPRARLVFAVDATASRSAAWNTAREVTDTLFQALPGQLDVALAVHGGSTVHTFTDFVTDPSILRETAAQISCKSGATKLIEIMQRTIAAPDAKVLLYIGDTFEEPIEEAREVAGLLNARGVRMIVLHDEPQRDQAAGDVFADLAHRTGGFVLPFDAGAAARIREVLEAVAVLAVGGIKLLQEKKNTLAAAPLLLSHLPHSS